MAVGQAGATIYADLAFNRAQVQAESIRAASIASTAFNTGFRDIRTPSLGALSKQVGGARAEFNQLTEASNDFGDSLTRGLRRIIALSAASAALFGIAKAFQASLQASRELEKSLQDINVILNLPTKQLQAFGKDLFDVARNTKQSFEEVGKAAVEFARQGLGVEETLKRTEAALILVNLAGVNATDATETLTAAMNSFNKENLSAVQIVNKIVAVDAAFAVSAADLAESIRRVGSTAQDAGVSFDRLVSITTAAQQVTQRGGSVIGNALKTIFQRLQRSETLDQLEQLGIQVREVDSATQTFTGNLLPADQILRQLGERFKTLNQEQRAQVSEMVAGVFQGNIFRGILNGLSFEQAAYTKSLGATDEAIRRNAALLETQDAKYKQAGETLRQVGANVANIGFGDVTKTFLDSFNSSSIVKALAGTGGDVGNQFGQIFIKAFSDVLLGPGLIAIAGIGLKIAQTLGQYGKTVFTQINPLGDTTRLDLNKQITTFLTQQNDKLIAINASSMTEAQKQAEILRLFEQQNTVLAQRLALSREITSLLTIQGPAILAASTAKATATVPKTLRVPAKSIGYIPTAADGLSEAMTREQLAISRGDGGAHAAARPVYLPNFKTEYGAGAVANTSEYVVPNFSGTGKAAILNREMVSQIGLPNGAYPVMSDGYVPNYPGGNIPASWLFKTGAKKAVQNFYWRARNIKTLRDSGKTMIANALQQKLDTEVGEYIQYTEKVGIKSPFELNGGYIPNYAGMRIPSGKVGLGFIKKGQIVFDPTASAQSNHFTHFTRDQMPTSVDKRFRVYPDGSLHLLGGDQLFSRTENQMVREYLKSIGIEASIPSLRNWSSGYVPNYPAGMIKFINTSKLPLTTELESAISYSRRYPRLYDKFPIEVVSANSPRLGGAVSGFDTKRNRVLIANKTGDSQYDFLARIAHEYRHGAQSLTSSLTTVPTQLGEAYWSHPFEQQARATGENVQMRAALRGFSGGYIPNYPTGTPLSRAVGGQLRSVIALRGSVMDASKRSRAVEYVMRATAKALPINWKRFWPIFEKQEPVFAKQLVEKGYVYPHPVTGELMTPGLSRGYVPNFASPNLYVNIQDVGAAQYLGLKNKLTGRNVSIERALQMGWLDVGEARSFAAIRDVAYGSGQSLSQIKQWTTSTLGSQPSINRFISKASLEAGKPKGLGFIPPGPISEAIINAPPTVRAQAALTARHMVRGQAQNQIVPYQGIVTPGFQATQPTLTTGGASTWGGPPNRPALPYNPQGRPLYPLAIREPYIYQGATPPLLQDVEAQRMVAKQALSEQRNAALEKRRTIMSQRMGSIGMGLLFGGPLGVEALGSLYTGGITDIVGQKRAGRMISGLGETAGIAGLGVQLAAGGGPAAPWIIGITAAVVAVKGLTSVMNNMEDSIQDTSERFQDLTNVTSQRIQNIQSTRGAIQNLQVGMEEGLPPAQLARLARGALGQARGITDIPLRQAYREQILGRQFGPAAQERIAKLEEAMAEKEERNLILSKENLRLTSAEFYQGVTPKGDFLTRLSDFLGTPTPGGRMETWEGISPELDQRLLNIQRLVLKGKTPEQIQTRQAEIASTLKALNLVPGEIVGQRGVGRALVEPFTGAIKSLNMIAGTIVSLPGVQSLVTRGINVGYRGLGAASQALGLPAFGRPELNPEDARNQSLILAANKARALFGKDINQAQKDQLDIITNINSTEQQRATALKVLVRELEEMKKDTSEIAQIIEDDKQSQQKYAEEYKKFVDLRIVAMKAGFLAEQSIVKRNIALDLELSKAGIERGLRKEVRTGVTGANVEIARAMGVPEEELQWRALRRRPQEIRQELEDQNAEFWDSFRRQQQETMDRLQMGAVTTLSKPENVKAVGKLKEFAGTEREGIQKLITGFGDIKNIDELRTKLDDLQKVIDDQGIDKSIHEVASQLMNLGNEAVLSQTKLEGTGAKFKQQLEGMSKSLNNNLTIEQRRMEILQKQARIAALERPFRGGPAALEEERRRISELGKKPDYFKVATKTGGTQEERAMAAAERIRELEEMISAPGAGKYIDVNRLNAEYEAMMRIINESLAKEWDKAERNLIQNPLSSPLSQQFELMRGREVYGANQFTLGPRAPGIMGYRNTWAEYNRQLSGSWAAYGNRTFGQPLGYNPPTGAQRWTRGASGDIVRNAPEIPTTGLQTNISAVTGLSDAVKAEMPKLTDALLNFGKNPTIESLTNAIKGGVNGTLNGTVTLDLSPSAEAVLGAGGSTTLEDFQSRLTALEIKFGTKEQETRLGPTRPQPTIATGPVLAPGTLHPNIL